MEHKDYYRILDVEEDATAAEIKAAYRRLARKYHPDVSGIKDAEERFKEVAEAYDTLKDPSKRITYDRLVYRYEEREFGRAPDWERQFGEFFSCAGTDESGDDDLYVTIALRPHPLFRVDGNDLTLDVPVTPWEAALGTTLEVPTLEGRVKLRIPPGTQSQRKLRLAGRGLPRPDGGSGDLYAHIQIVTPSVLSERERELYAELARASSFEPRAHLT